MAEDNAQDDGARRVNPLGNHANWSDREIGRLATVTDRDKVDARDYWHENAPRTIVQADGTTLDARELIDADDRRKRRHGGR